MRNFAILSVLLIALTSQFSCSKKAVEPEIEGPSLPQIDEASGAPGANAIDQPVTLTLKWKCIDPNGDSLSYDIHLDTVSPPGRIVEGHALTEYQPATLTHGRKYYCLCVLNRVL